MVRWSLDEREYLNIFSSVVVFDIAFEGLCHLRLP